MFVCGIGFLGFLAAYVWPQPESKQASIEKAVPAGSVNDPGGWSVSFQINGPLLAMWDKDFKFIAIDKCILTNISKIQRRIIDVRLDIPVNSLSVRIITLDTKDMDKQIYGDLIRSTGQKLGRVWRPLDSPIIIEPDTISQGWIELPVSDELYQDVVRHGLNGVGFLDLDHATVTLTDHISGQSIKMPYGTRYDAVTAKVITSNYSAISPPAAPPPSPVLPK